MREVEVKALLVDPMNNGPVILLKDNQTEKVVPVWIGKPEATAIAMQLQHQEFPRPLTHDLLKTFLKVMNCELDMVVIDSIQETIYYATLHVRDKEGQVHEIDARPSDSIAMALRTGSPIYVADEVFEASAIDLPETEEGVVTNPAERKKFEEFVKDEMHIADFKRFIQ
jgi:hypothetical protein